MTNPELEHAILEAPDDDAPRLVYGDWLQEQGDPRGELVAVQRAQLAIGAHPDPEHVARLVDRERELIAKHAREWLGPLSPDSVTWRLGFVDTLDVAAHSFAAVMQLESTRFVRSIAVELDIPLREIPTLPTVRALALWMRAVSAVDVAPWLDPVRFPKVRTLRFGSVRDRAFADALVEQLVISDLFNELLDVEVVDFDDASYDRFEYYLLKRHVNLLRS